MSQKASASIADRKMEKSAGTSTQPCLTPFVILNVSETSPLTLTFAIIPVCSASIIVVNFSGQLYFLSSCHNPVLPTVSNALLWLVLLSSLFVQLSETKYHIHAPVSSETTLCSRNYLWCYVGRESVDEDPGEILDCYVKKRDTCIVPTICSITFLVDGYNAGILPCLWYRTHLPGIGD